MRENRNREGCEENANGSTETVKGNRKCEELVFLIVITTTELNLNVEINEKGSYAIK